MKIRTIALASFALLVAAVLHSADVPAAHVKDPLPPANSAAPAGWKLVWSDEFDTREIDRKKWDFDLGNSASGGNRSNGWGNNELEYYTSRPENAFIEDDALHIRAIRESYKGFKYTSARLKTKGLFSKKYGRFDFRAKLPTGKGLWPALWLLPEENKFGGWAASGEIDVMEARGQAAQKVLGTLHYGSRAPGNVHTGKDYTLPDDGSISGFHVYSVEWEPGEVRWLVDEKVYETQNFWWSYTGQRGARGARPQKEADLNPWPAPFDQPFYIILNVAVGGQFLGNPDDSTTFPVDMVVDYVRVYDRTDGYGEAKPRGDGKLPFNRQ
jgi:beta-glucanase (GH16 family)